MHIRTLNLKISKLRWIAKGRNINNNEISLKKTITRSIAKPQWIKTPIPTPITKKPTYLPQMENNKIEDNITKKKKKD